MANVKRFPGGALQTEDGRWIPADPRNADYRALAADIASGKATVTDFEPPEAPPEEKVSQAIDAAIPLAAFADLIPELAATIPKDQAPKLHAMKDQIDAIKAEIGGK